MKRLPSEIENLIREHNGELLRGKTHLVFGFPDGRRFTVPNTPSDAHAYKNCLADLKRFLGLQKFKTTIGERREKRKRQRSVQSIKVERPSARLARRVDIEALRDLYLQLPKQRCQRVEVPERCEGAMWVERVYQTPLTILLRRIFQ
jgi:hypothetical protein